MNHLSFDELCSLALNSDNPLAKRLAEEIYLFTPAKPLDLTLEEVEELTENLKEAEDQIKALQNKVEQLSTALQTLRFRFFAYQSCEDFSEEYEFITNSQDLPTEYCPDLNITAAYTLKIDGELEEVWVTEASNYYRNDTRYQRVL